MGGGGMNTSATRLEALNIQSSTAGAVIPWLRGQHRIPGNLVWYSDFKATSHTQQQGGKGGGGTSTSYTYSASLLMGLCHGTIHSIANVWKGKGVSSTAALGLSVLTGAVAQAMWSGLAGRGVQSLNYSGLAGVAALNYQLGDSASVENHSFEVRHSSAYSVVGAGPDVDPQAATYDLLTHPHQGAAFPAALIGDWSDWSDYCIANKLLISPLLTTQTSARDALAMMADLTNTGIVWSDGKLKMRPYGDAEATAYGRTFTPDTTPVYELDDNCYIKSGDEAPVKRSLKSPAALKNIVKVQYRDRANGYNPAVVEAKDLTDISANGARPLDMIEADWICVGEVARFVAEIRKQRELLVVGEYTFRLPWHYVLIECMDLLTLTDSVLMLDGVPVRVRTIVEESDEELAFTCEDFPAGVASAPLYPSQGMTGFALNANVAPGDAMAPVVFELPGALTTTGLELAVATGSTDPNWGGCLIWVSYDGATYRQLTELRATSRYGTLQLDSGSSMQLFTNAGQQLLSGSAADAGNLSTLFYVAPAGGIDGEFMAYETATLTAPNAYTLAGLVRGVYGTLQAEHGAAAPWVRVDDAVARSGPLDPALIGKTVYIKLTSFNVFGGAPQSLADVAPTTYTITGKHFVFGAPSSTLGIKLNVNNFAGAVNYSEAYIHGRNSSGAAVDAPGVIMVSGVPMAVPNGPLNTNFGPVAGYIVWDAAGATFSVLGTAFRPYVLARRFRGNWQYDDNNSGGWTNFTVTPTHYVIGTLESGAGDTGAPGTAPGLIAASLWAAAVTPNAIEASADDAYAVAFAAQGTADTAATNATSALSTLATMRSNGYLDASEKPMANKQWHELYDAQTGIVAQANSLAITTERDAYTAAISALGTYLSDLVPSWVDTTVDTPITPAVDAATWAAAYQARQALLNKIASEAAKRANWGNVTGADRPADNATADIVLIADGGMTITGNTATKTSGGGGWNAAVRSRDSFAGGAYASWVHPDTSYSFGLGLNSDPAANSSYDTVDAWLYNSGTELYVYNNGAVQNGGTKVGDVASGDVLAVTYDGNALRYIRNGTALFIQPALITAPLFLDSSFDTMGGRATNIKFGPMTSIASALAAAADALEAAADAQTIANGKIQLFHQDTAPSGQGESEGDIWLDTNDGNKQYVYITGVWVVAADTRIGDAIAAAAGAQATADGKVNTYFQAGEPTAESVGDLWVDSDDSNKSYRWSGSAWVSVRDGGIALAISNAAAAQTTADTAATNATAALSTLATMRSNGYLDASEKPALMRAWQAITDEVSNIGSQGIAYGLTTLKDAYQDAFTDLFTYLYTLSPSWNDTTVDTPITPAVDQATWAAYYSARQTLLIAISDEAAERAIWSSVGGTDKPADNATVGATFGVDISGQAGTDHIAATAVTELASASDHVAYSNIG